METWHVYMCQRIVNQLGKNEPVNNGTKTKGLFPNNNNNNIFIIISTTH